MRGFAPNNLFDGFVTFRERAYGARKATFQACLWSREKMSLCPTGVSFFSKFLPMTHTYPLLDQAFDYYTAHQNELVKRFAGRVPHPGMRPRRRKPHH
jgi:hypothetical protein